MLLPSDTFAPVSVSQLSFYTTDLAYLRYSSLSILGDQRREAAYADCFDQLMARGEAGLSQLSFTASDTQRFSRLLNNQGMSVAALVDHACSRSVPFQEVSPKVKEDQVLVLSDSSNIGLKSAALKVKSKGGALGVLNDGSAPGLMLHASLAITATSHRVIGLADAVMYSRSEKSPGESRHRASAGRTRADKNLNRVDKESHVWETGAVNARRLLQEKGYNHRVYVHDAGSDDKTVFSRLLELKIQNEAQQASGRVSQQDDFVIRMRNYQRVFYEGYRRDDDPELANIPWFDSRLKRLSKGKYLAKAPLEKLLQQQGAVQGTIQHKIRPLQHVSKKFKKRSRKGRKANLKVKTIKIRYCDMAGRWHELNIVYAWENPRSLPKGERKSAVKWVLLTSLPVDTFEEAIEVIRIYRSRWYIEQLFRVLKKDGLKIEKIQLADVEAIMKLMTMALEVAATVLQLVQARGQSSGHPIEQVFEPEYLPILKAVNREYEGNTVKQQNPYPEDQLSYATWVIARMGGWNVYSKKPPGPKIIARGLADFIRFADLTIRISNSDNVLS